MLVQFEPCHLGTTDIDHCGWNTLMYIICTGHKTEVAAKVGAGALRAGDQGVSARELHWLIHSVCSQEFLGGWRYNSQLSVSCTNTWHN